MKNSLTIVTKVCTNTSIFLLQKMLHVVALQKLLTFYFSKKKKKKKKKKNINAFAIFSDRNFNVII